MPEKYLMYIPELVMECAFKLQEASGLQKELQRAHTTLQKQQEKAQESGEMQKRVEYVLQM